MLNIEFKQLGSSLETRLSGAVVRKVAEEALSKNDKVVFDFSSVQKISNSFADECFGKLIKAYDKEHLARNISFLNTSPFIASVIVSAFKERFANSISVMELEETIM